MKQQIADTHEHGPTGKVYAYRAEYSVESDAIRWAADVFDGVADRFQIDGSIELSSPGVAAVAEEAVRDAVLQSINSRAP